jgi:hypothetical protein
MALRTAITVTRRRPQRHRQRAQRPLPTKDCTELCKYEHRC